MVGRAILSARGTRWVKRNRENEERVVRSEERGKSAGRLVKEEQGGKTFEEVSEPGPIIKFVGL